MTTRALLVDSTGVILVTTRALLVDSTGVILVTRAAGVDSTDMILVTRESVTKDGKVNQQIILTMHKTYQSPRSQEGSHTLLPVVGL